MADINNVKIEPHLNLKFGRTGKSNRGGDGGSIFIFTKKMKGSGKILVDGGDGNTGGDAGKVHIHTDDNQFKGKISAKGGKGRR